jgi:hypothetical protein
MTPHVVDLETYLIEPGILAPRIVCGSHCAEGSQPEVLLRDDMVALMLDLLADESVLLIGARIPYDLGCLCAHRPGAQRLVSSAYQGGRIYDVILADQLLQIYETGRCPESSLAACAKRYLGVDIFESKKDPLRLTFSEVDGVPLDRWPRERIEYCLRDASLPLEIWRAQLGGANLELMAENAWADWHLHRMALWGLRTDQVVVAAFIRELKTALSELREQLQEAGLVRPDGTRDMDAIRARLVERLGEDAPLTATGLVSTAGDVLEEACALSNDDDLKALGTYVALDKVYSGWAQHLQAPIITPRWHVVVGTGRTSCTRPPMQTLPRGGVEI